MLLWIIIFAAIFIIPGLIIFGLVYYFMFKKIKRRKLFLFVLSFLSSILSPVSLYIIGYIPTSGWINGTAEIFVMVIFGFPLIIIINYFVFVLLNRILQKRELSHAST
jgi:hypothetical protein